MTAAHAAPRLRGLATRRAVAPTRGADDAERCDLCAEPLPPRHRHLLELPAETVACACRACAVLFDPGGAGGGRYRLLPDRRLRLDGLDLDDLRWAALGVPVELAYFVRSGATGEVTARYPNPLGTMRAPVNPAAWAALRQAHPALPGMADDVEALLADRTRGHRRHWLLPLDDCHRLAAVLRTHWRGLSGGDEVHRHLQRFFEELEELSERSGT